MRRMLNRINDFLDKYVLPWPVRFLTFRFVILATISLLIPLIVFAANTSLVLMINSYLNTMSVAVSSIVLLYATISEMRQKRIAELQEQRAQEDHEHIIATNDLVMRALANQYEEFQDLKELLSVQQGIAYQREPSLVVPDLRTLHAQGVARFDKGRGAKLVDQNLKKNLITLGLQGENASTDERNIW